VPLGGCNNAAFQLLWCIRVIKQKSGRLRPCG
jgi:hypothetical protein